MSLQVVTLFDKLSQFKGQYFEVLFQVPVALLEELFEFVLAGGWLLLLLD